MREKMLTLNKIERNKDPKARRVIRKCNITSASEIPQIEEEL